MAGPIKSPRRRGSPVTLKEHLRYWLGVACFYLRALIKLVLMPLLLVITFGTGSLVQGTGQFTWLGVFLLWLLLALCIAGLKFCHLS